MKTDLRTKIRQIETEYPVGTIEYKGIKIWPFIRTAIFLSYFRSEELTVKENRSWKYKFSQIGRILRILRTTSLCVLFKKNTSVLFTDDAGSEIRYIDEKVVDIFAFPITNYEKDIIPIVIKMRSESITAFKHYVNSDLFILLSKLYLCIINIDKKNIVNKQVLVKIIFDLKIVFDIDKNIANIISLLVIFRLYFKLIRPKNIFLICYYDIDKMAASYVAKEMNIPVIELQHGIIANRYPPYFTEVSIIPNPYPDYLFCFGEAYKKFVSPFIYDSKNIFTIGSYYIDYIKKNKDKNKELFFKKYSNTSSRIIITVAGQTIFDIKMLEFIEKVSEICRDIYFIYIPRNMDSGFMQYSHDNICIETELDVYQCMQNSHISSTVSSTCAVESFAFGTPVILMNIQNFAKVCYSDFFSPSDAVFYADTPEEYVSCIATAINKDRKQISSDATYYYTENPQECTRKAFEKLTEHNKRGINESK